VRGHRVRVGARRSDAIDRVEDGDQGNSDEGGKDLASWPPNASRGKRGRRIGLALFLRLGASAIGLRLIYG
jgi:hypothetical protein